MKKIWYASIIVAVGGLSGAILAQTVNVGAGGSGFSYPKPLCPAPGCTPLDACLQGCTPNLGGSFEVLWFGKKGCSTYPNCRSGSCTTKIYNDNECDDLVDTQYPSVYHCDDASPFPLP